MSNERNAGDRNSLNGPGASRRSRHATHAATPSTTDAAGIHRRSGSPGRTNQMVPTVSIVPVAGGTAAPMATAAHPSVGGLNQTMPRLPAFAWSKVPSSADDSGQVPAPNAIPDDASEAVTVERPEPPPRFLTVLEVADILGVSEKTVRRRIADGDLRKAPFGGRIIRIPATELRRLGRS